MPALAGVERALPALPGPACPGAPSAPLQGAAGLQRCENDGSREATRQQQYAHVELQHCCETV